MAATSAPRIGVLAIQGAFREHVRSLCLCGAETVEIRTREDLEGLSGLVFPGGESTVMGKFLIEWGMMDRVRELIRSGMPVFGTCAGLILLCSDILDHPGQPRIGLLNASVRRNAFGRQIDSFTTPLELCPFPTANGNPTDQPPLEAVFIRAPLIEKIGPGVEVLARVNGFPVAVRQGNVLCRILLLFLILGCFHTQASLLSVKEILFFLQFLFFFFKTLLFFCEVNKVCKWHIDCCFIYNY